MTHHFEIQLSFPNQSFPDKLQLFALKYVRNALRSTKFRGLGFYCKLLARLTSSQGPLIDVNLPHGGKFTMPLYDTTWQSYLYRDRIYEEEIDFFISNLDETAFDWVDCGANFGYWCCWLAGNSGTGAKRIIAIEPSPTCLTILRHNVANVAPRVDLVEKALHSSSGKMISFFATSVHVASQVFGDEADSPIYPGNVVTVETVSLDRIFDEFDLGPRPVIVKLDVEGQEANAIKNFGRFSDADILFIYEDHGKDPSCESSVAMLQKGYEIFALTDFGQKKLSGVDDVRALKTQKVKGYNFAATSSTFWLSHLAG